MSRSNAWSWTFMLLATCLFGVGLGLSLGYALFSPRGQRPAPTQVAQDIEPATQPESTPPSAPANAKPPASKPSPPRATTASVTAPLDENAYWAARHLFITVNGQWLAEGTEEFLRTIKPGGVLLRDVNLGTRTQTFELVKQIKQAVGLGSGLGDLPLIAVEQEGGPYNLLGLENAPSAQTVGQSGDEALARKLGVEYGQACIGRGIAIALAPVLDVYEKGAINPGLAARTFGTEEALVSRMGLAMADGLRQGGVLPVVKHFPGYGAATYGPDGLLVVLNKDYKGLAKVLFPFNEAVDHGTPGVLVGYVAVPALDPESPRRPAALSPILVKELLRARWGYEGVVLADDIAFNPMTRSLGPEKTAVQALAAGCDALLMLDPDPARIRSVCKAIADAVATGELDQKQLDASVKRLERWQQAIGNLNPIAAATEEPPRMARLTPSPTRDALAGAASSDTDDESTPPMQTSSTKEQSGTQTATDSISSQDAKAAPPPPPTSKPADSAPVSTSGTKVAAKPDEDVAAEPVTELPAPETQTEGENLSDRSEIVHIVQPEQTLAGIAAMYGVSAEDLARWNGLEQDTVEAGAKLTVYLPASGEAPERVASKTPQPGEQEDTTEQSPLPSATETDKPPVDALKDVTYKVAHVVESGETLAELADEYGVKESDITLWNGLESNELEAGQVLTIFVGQATHDALSAPPEPAPAQDVQTTAESEQEAQPEFEAEPVKTEIYVVQSGDTLNKISRDHNVSKERLLELNGIDDPNHIWVGQRLKVPVTPTAAEQ